MSLTVTPGTGATVATEDISSVKYSQAKLVDATVGSTAPTGVAANPLQVSLANHGANATAVKVDGSAVTQPVSGTVTANAGSGTMAVSAAALPLPSGASTSAKQPALGTAGTASTDVLTVQGIASMTALKVDLSATTANATAVKVDASATTQPISGTVTANIGTSGSLALDASVTGTQVAQASTTSGQKGTLIQGAVTTAAPTYTTAQTSPLSLTTAGALRTDASATTQPVSISGNQAVNNAQINGVTPLMGNGVTGTGSQRVTIASDNTAFTVNAAQSGTWTVGSSTATGSAVPANAFYNGALAKTSLPSAGSDGNQVGLMSDKFGRQVVVTNGIRDIVGTQTTTISASTSETTIVTAAASVFNDLVSLIVSNTSATAARVDFRDTTAGSVLFSLYVPAGDTRGATYTTPVPQTSVNTNWTAQSSASVTDLRIYAQFIKNK
jgi:hypothetical protein